MDANFTKGKWIVKPAEDEKDYIRIRGITPGGRFKIADVHDQKFTGEDAPWKQNERRESIANANLISCSPDMYEELTEVVKRYKNIIEFKLMAISHHEFLQGEIERLEGLLAKARGEL